MKRTTWIWIAGLLSCGLPGCSGESSTPATPVPEPSTPLNGDRFVSELALAPLLPESRELTGVASTNDGRLFVLDRHHGLFEVFPDRAVPLFTLAELPARFGLPATLAFTDVTTLGDARFALTAENDGYLFDPAANVFTSHFCYFPPLDATETTPDPVSVSQVLTAQGIPARQLTESVAYSAESGTLFAQPRTFRMDTGAVAGAEVLSFSAAGGGTPEQVFPIDDWNFVAGGMITEGGSTLLLGAGRALYSMAVNTQPALLHTFASDLRINGMTRMGNNVVLLDDIGKRLIWVDRASF